MRQRSAGAAGTTTVATGTHTIGTVATATSVPGAAQDTAGAGAMHSTTGTGATFTVSMVAGNAAVFLDVSLSTATPRSRWSKRNILLSHSALH